MGEERADEAKPKTNVTVTCRQGRGRTTVKRNTKPEGRPGRLLYGLWRAGEALCHESLHNWGE